jgi:GUN4-like
MIDNPNSNILDTEIKSSLFMRQIDWILSLVLAKSLREESIGDLWDYYYELHNKGIPKFKITYLIVWESILFVQLSLKICIQELKERRKFNPSAELLLRQRFLESYQSDRKKEIPVFISWDEYNLFLNDQLSGIFHSRASIPKNTGKNGAAPVTVTEISIEDAHWFCAWLSMKSTFHPESQGKVYDYRFILTDEGVKVTRVEIPTFYKELQKHLSYGDWSSADKEYSHMTLILTRREKFGFLTEEDVVSISQQDFDIFDNLWQNFSGGKFGLNVQIEIYYKCKRRFERFLLFSRQGLSDFDEIVLKSFEQEIGWRNNEGEWIDFNTDIVWSLNASKGHLPCKPVSRSSNYKRMYTQGLLSRKLPPPKVLTCIL